MWNVLPGCRKKKGMAAARTARKTKECASAGRRYACPEFEEREVEPTSAQLSRFRQLIRRARDAQTCLWWDSLRQREELLSAFNSRRYPVSVCQEMARVCPWSVEIRRACCIRLRHGILRMKKRPPPANVSGLGSVLGGGGEATLEGASS